MNVHLVASGGGHLDLLRRVAPSLDGHELTWATTPGRSADALRSDGERVVELPPVDRTNPGLANARRATGAVLRRRPDAVVTSGAGNALAYTATARLLGARVLFAETMARVTDSSLSGRFLSRLAHEVFVQWPEMQRVHPGAVVCRPALFETLSPGEPRPGEGTFVALGTHHQGFERLLAAVREGCDAGILPTPVRGQIGHTGPAALHDVESDVAPFMAPAAMEEAIAGAAVVVCHAGAGIIATAVRHGRRPLVMARLGSHDEHVDDHQTQLAAKVDELGLGVWVRDRIAEADVRRAAIPPVTPRWPQAMPSVGPAVARALAG